MKVTNGDMFGAVQAFQEIVKIELPAKTSWMLVKLASKVEARCKSIEKVRTGLVLKYGKLNEETRQTEIKPDSESWSDFVAGYNELMEQEDEIDMEKIKIPEEVNGKPVMVTASTLAALEKFIEV